MIYVLAVTFQDVRNWCHENDTNIRDTVPVLYPQKLDGVLLDQGDRIVHAPHFHRNPLYSQMIAKERQLRGFQ